MTSENDLLRTFTEMPFKANGAGLTLSAVAAGNIFTDGEFQGSFTAPAWLFLIGLVFAYLLLAFTTKLSVNSGNLLTAQNFRRTALDCEMAEHPTARMKEIAEDCIVRADRLEAEQLPDAQIALFTRLLNWFNNLSLACFVAGVAVGLLILL